MTATTVAAEAGDLKKKQPPQPVMGAEAAQLRFKAVSANNTRPNDLRQGEIPRSLDDLADHSRWVAWKYAERSGRRTKVPLTVDDRLAASDDQQTWDTRANVMNAPLPNRAGVGINLGALDGPNDGLTLIGVDLDACVGDDGHFASWASAIIQHWNTYAEISPSKHGVKLFALVQTHDMPAIREAMGTDHGRTWKRQAATGEQAPAIELHCGNRYYTVTDEHFPCGPKELRTISLADVLWLIQDAGPAFKRGADKLVSLQAPTHPSMVTDRAAPLASANSNDQLWPRLQEAILRDPKLEARWSGGVDDLNDHSRSGRDQSMACLLRRNGFSPEDVRALLTNWPYGAGAEKAGDDRYFERMWSKAESSVGGFAVADPNAWQDPDLGVLDQNRRPPVQFPVELFGPWWSKWVTETAASAAAAPDYVAAPLLAAISILLGNARWVQAAPGWREPPVLWCASVGNPSSGKSPGAGPIMNQLIGNMESSRLRDFKDRFKAWQGKNEAALARLAQWKQQVAIAVRKNEMPPPKPVDAESPPEPVQPRIRTSDATTEKIAHLLAGNPKGLLVVRDELAGWLGSFNRYTSASADRPFYLESYVGGSYTQDRVKHPIPIQIERLALALFGTIQPDRLAETIRGADDGLLPRFLWFWPEPVIFAIARQGTDIDGAKDRLQHLNELPLREVGEDDDKVFMPVYVPLTPEAVDLLEAFGQEMQSKETTTAGLLLSAYGKARGHALRLSLVLEYLWWCGLYDRTVEPTQVSVAAAQAAITLVRDYLLPMAERVFGDAASTPAERDAKALARFIVAYRLTQLNLRELGKATRGWHGPKEPNRLKAAADRLVEAGWLMHAGKRGTQGGRPPTTYQANPRVFDLLAEREAGSKAA
jgi:hypothetical protein